MIDRQFSLAKLKRRGQTSNPEAKARYRAGKAARKERKTQARLAALSPCRCATLKADLRAAGKLLTKLRWGGFVLRGGVNMWEVDAVIARPGVKAVMEEE